MRGDYQEGRDLFGDVSIGKRVRPDHTVRRMRKLIDVALAHLDAIPEKV